MFKKNKKAAVVLSGGMDSAICLALCVKNFGKDEVIAITFDYGQRHAEEKTAAKNIALHFQVEHQCFDLAFYQQLTSNALMDHNVPIVAGDLSTTPNTLVVGRNGLFARLGAIYSHHRNVQHLYMGVLGLEAANSGYRDCNREYFDLMEKILRLDLGTNDFWIHTPLVEMTKMQTLELALELSCLDFVLEQSISCYEGIKHEGCGKCPACILRNAGIREFLQSNPSFNFSYKNKF